MLDRIKKSATLAGISAGIMYLFDPNLGRRRRSLLFDQWVHAKNKLCKAADVTARDMQHRLYGTYCELRAKVRGRDTSDEVVADRVRAKLGRYVSHPSAVAVRVHDGCAFLSGAVLADEVESLLAAVRSVDGVLRIENLLDVRESPGNVAALQGGFHRNGEPLEWMQTTWSPTARFVAGTTGALLMINCLAKRTPLAMTFGTAGFLMMLRAVTNQPLAQHAELGGRVRGGKDTSALAGAAPAGSNTPKVRVDDAAETPPAIQRVYRPVDDDFIDEASMESFPASDAPNFTRR